MLSALILRIQKLKMVNNNYSLHPKPKILLQSLQLALSCFQKYNGKKS